MKVAFDESKSSSFISTSPFSFYVASNFLEVLLLAVLLFSFFAILLSSFSLFFGIKIIMQIAITTITTVIMAKFYFS